MGNITIKVLAGGIFSKFMYVIQNTQMINTNFDSLYIENIDEKSLINEEKLVSFFAEYFPDTKAVIPDLVRDYFNNPTSSLVVMKCFPWTFEDKVALIGDSVHAIVPFYGHGMNAGFEDITILNELMKEYGDDWNKIFKAYEISRKPNADAIAELSRRNFMEMSAKTADEQFLLQKKIEKWFSEKHPDKWMPLYSRVTFSLQPYADAMAVGDFQNSIMQEVLTLANIEEIWNSPIVENKILELLKKH
jgi:kynurenine 3-monooxygenase